MRPRATAGDELRSQSLSAQSVHDFPGRGHGLGCGFPARRMTFDMLKMAAIGLDTAKLQDGGTDSFFRHGQHGHRVGRSRAFEPYVEVYDKGNLLPGALRRNFDAIQRSRMVHGEGEIVRVLMKCDKPPQRLLAGNRRGDQKVPDAVGSKRFRLAHLGDANARRAGGKLHPCNLR